MQLRWLKGKFLCVNEILPAIAVSTRIHSSPAGTKTNTAHLARIAELIGQGVIKPQVDKVFPLEKVKEAFDYFEKSHPRGKIVLKIK